MKKIIAAKTYTYYPDIIKDLKNLKINHLFCGIKFSEFGLLRKECKESGIRFFPIQEIFRIKSLDITQPSIDQDGNIGKKEWLITTCPSNKNYRKNKIESIRNMVEEFMPDGVSLDFIRYFTFWEKVDINSSPDALNNHCFCDECIKAFSKSIGFDASTINKNVKPSQWILENYKEEWTKWKCEIIASMVKEIREEIITIKPDIQIAIHAVPWRQSDLDGSIKSIIGQDFKLISPYVDIVSPMCYHWMLYQDPTWINSVSQDIFKVTQKTILLSIQVSKAYRPDEIPVEEFSKAIEEALKSPSTGINLWSFDELMKSPLKQKIFIEQISYHL